MQTCQRIARKAWVCDCHLFVTSIFLHQPYTIDPDTSAMCWAAMVLQTSEPSCVLFPLLTFLLLFWVAPPLTTMGMPAPCTPHSLHTFSDIAAMTAVYVCVPPWTHKWHMWDRIHISVIRICGGTDTCKTELCQSRWVSQALPPRAAVEQV